MPISEKLASFVEAVRGSGLLPNAEVDALAHAASQPDADPEPLARDLVQRKLLTAYQVRRLWKGRGPELFLNQYVLIDRLGEGGMGEVFKARHTRLDRDVALKVMRKEKMANPEAVKRFRREIRAAATLAHENVVMAYDADQSGDVHFFAMEFVDGTTLDRLVRDKDPLPVDEACDYIRQAALGLQHAYEKGLTHRDVKPANLLVDKNGVVKITDLGLVLVDPASGEVATQITREGLTVGTPDFVAPEQARNPRAADVRADIYALGCTLYYVLTGEVPFPGGTPTEKMLRHSRDTIPVPTRAEIGAGVLEVLAKMTARKPEQRYGTPAEVVAALEPFARRAGPPPTPPPLPTLTESLTADDLPTPPTAPPVDSRFQLPSKTDRPRARRAGCFGVVLVGLAVGVAIGRMV
ncbi:MAG TPA: serine/threonine-protein kinase [Gemmataceae bacterium]|jgi:serine/threonine protein kinase|nr:serine/threonine-protein kinase [Gemmataceae bacterium]